MANVKLNEKALLDRIQARLILLKGHKYTQQEVLDKCINFSNRNFRQFVNQEFGSPELTPKKINSILVNSVDAGHISPKISDDDLIYGHEQ